MPRVLEGCGLCFEDSADVGAIGLAVGLLVQQIAGVPRS